MSQRKSLSSFKLFPNLFTSINRRLTGANNAETSSRGTRHNNIIKVVINSITQTYTYCIYKCKCTYSGFDVNVRLFRDIDENVFLNYISHTLLHYSGCELSNQISVELNT